MAVNTETCERCHKDVPSFDMVLLSHPDRRESICDRCWNVEIASQAGMDFQHPDFTPVTMKDIQGTPHILHFHTQIVNRGTLVEALEVKEGDSEGYELAVVGKDGEDPIVIFTRLYPRLKRELARRHVESTEHGPRDRAPADAAGRAGALTLRSSRAKIAYGRGGGVGRASSGPDGRRRPVNDIMMMTIPNRDRIVLSLRLTFDEWQMASWTYRQSKEAYELLEPIRRRVRLTAKSVLVKGPRRLFVQWRDDILRDLPAESAPFRRECLDRVESAIAELLRASEQVN